MVEVNKVNPINILKVIATMCVFMLHTYIFSSQWGFVYGEKTWILKTPAWAAVWIFFMLSGFFIGKGFYSGKYKEEGKYTIKSILRFYLSRVIKIGVPVLSFSLLTLILLEPQTFFGDKQIIWKILTFSFFNEPASNVIGVTWYVSTLMRLYLCAPFVMYILEKIFGGIKNNSKKKVMLVLLFVAIALLGLWGRINLYKRGVNWSSQVYVPFYCNLDIYVCGMLINFWDEEVKSIFKWGKFISWILVIALIVLNIRVYYMSDYIFDCLIIYQYVMPTIYIFVIGFFLLNFGNEKVRYRKLSLDSLKENPLRCVELFESISFEFYLVHSMVLNCIYLHVSNGETGIAIHLKLMVFAFVISTILAYLMNRAFRIRRA